MSNTYCETGSEIPEGSTVKKTAYATLGAAMIVVATLARSFGDGGLELLALLLVGLVLLIASADLPQNRKATLFNKNATVSAIDGLSLPAAKHLAADLAALTGVSLPLTDRAAIDAPGGAA